MYSVSLRENHPHFRLLRSRQALVGLLLPESADDRRLLPNRLIEDIAIDERALLNANRLGRWLGAS